MEIDVARLKKTIAEKNTTLEAVASVLKMNRSTLYRKLRGGGQGITVREAQRISLYLGLSFDETVCIFWSLHGADVCKGAM